MLGGIDLMEDALDDVWVIDLKVLGQLIANEAAADTVPWQLVTTTGEGPGKISNHRAVTIGRSIFVYGGLSNFENTAVSLFALDTDTMAWRKAVSEVLAAFQGP